MILSPIVLFVYSRPAHTRKVLESLSENRLSSQSILYIFADGPKPDATDEQIQNILEVRNVIREKLWCKEVNIIEKQKNCGLAASIVEGVTQIVEQYGKIIVLEDDIVTSKGFLEYMNNALNFYEKEDKVMHVAAYIPPLSNKLPPTYFYNTASCWGWGTWNRAWKYYNNDAKYLLNEIERNGLVSSFNVNDSYDFYGQLKANAQGELKTWAVRWYASFFLKGGYALHPYPSLVNNIGHYGNGENSGSDFVFHWANLADSIPVNAIPIVQDDRNLKIIARFNKTLYRETVFTKFKSFIGKLLPKSLIAYYRRLKYPGYQSYNEQKKNIVP
jgi:hypothetical protein